MATADGRPGSAQRNAWCQHGHFALYAAEKIPYAIERYRDEAARLYGVLDRQLGKIDAALVAMARGLGDKPFCSGVHFSLSDVAVGSALGYLDFRFPQIDWRTPHPNLARLSDKLSLRQSFVDSRPS